MPVVCGGQKVSDILELESQWVVGTEPWTCARVASALNLRGISLAS